MKINYKNPKTGKPSTVVLDDHLVDLFRVSLRLRGFDTWRDDMGLFVPEWAESHYSEHPKNFTNVHPTFTRFCEYRMMCEIGHALRHKHGKAVNSLGRTDLVRPDAENQPSLFDPENK